MAVIPQGSYGGLPPAIIKPLLPTDSTFVLQLPTTGAIAGAERTRLTMIRDAANGADPRLYAICVARLAQV